MAENPRTWIGRWPQTRFYDTRLLQVTAKTGENPRTWIGRRPQTRFYGTRLLQVTA